MASVKEILDILAKPDNVSIADLRNMLEGIRESPDKVKGYKEPGTGGNFLHALARLPNNKQAEVLPLFYLAFNKGVNVDGTDTEGNTPLHILASKGGHSQAILALQRCGANVNLTNNEGKKPGECFVDKDAQKLYDRLVPTLWECIEKGDAEAAEKRLEAWCFPLDGKNSDGEVQSLVDLAKDSSRDDIISILEAYSETLRFVQQILAGDVENAQVVLEQCGLDDINVNMPDTANLKEMGGDCDQRHLVIVAVDEVRLPEIVEFLAKKGADLSMYYQTFFPPGPLYFITEYSHPKLPEDLSIAMLKKADLSLKNYRGRTILYEAQTRSPDYAKKVLKIGVNIAERDLEGHTVVDNVLFLGMFHLLPAYYEYLVEMMETNGVENMEKLVLDGYDYIANTVDGFDALKIAQEKGLKDVVEYLEEAPKILAKIKTIHEHIKKNESEAAKALLDDKLALAKDKGGRNVLHLAVLYGLKDLVDYLLSKYPSTIHGRDNFRRTPLHYAAASGDPNTYQAIIKAGGDDSITDCHNLSPLDYLAELDAKALTPEEKAEAEKREVFLVKGMIERERIKRYGLKVYLKLQYDALKGRIEDDDAKGAKDILDAFEANIDDFVGEGITDKPILFTCVDHKAEETAIQMLEMGANPRVSWKGEDLVESVYKADLRKLYNYLIELLGLNNRPYTSSTDISITSSQVPMPSKPEFTKPTGGGNPNNRFAEADYPTRVDAKFLANQLGYCLQLALADVAEKRPWDPIEYVGQWLHKFADNARRDKKTSLDQYDLGVAQAEGRKEYIRERRITREADQIRREEADKRRKAAEARERERQQAEEEERRARELEEVQKKQREGTEPYSQAPDLDTVKEEESSQQPTVSPSATTAPPAENIPEEGEEAEEEKQPEEPAPEEPSTEPENTDPQFNVQ